MKIEKRDGHVAIVAESPPDESLLVGMVGSITPHGIDKVLRDYSPNSSSRAAHKRAMALYTELLNVIHRK